MDLEKLKSLLGEIDARAEPQPGCPDNDQFASFMEGGLSESSHQTLSLHLADCEYCLSRAGILGRARETEPTFADEILLARAGMLASPADSRATSAFWRRPQALAAAALMVLAVNLVLTGKGTPPIQPTPLQQRSLTSDLPETRSLSPLKTTPNIQVPGNAFLSGGEQGLFTWSAVQDSLYYEIRIVSDEGDLLWQQRVSHTQWRLPEALELKAGAEYFVRVDAFLAGSKSVNSDYVPFTVEAER